MNKLDFTDLQQAQFVAFVMTMFATMGVIEATKSKVRALLFLAFLGGLIAFLVDDGDFLRMLIGAMVAFSLSTIWQLLKQLWSPTLGKGPPT